MALGWANFTDRCQAQGQCPDGTLAPYLRQLNQVGVGNSVSSRWPGSRARFPSGEIDLTRYRADPEILRRYSQGVPYFDRYAQNGFDRDYKLAFGNLPNNVGITPEELRIIGQYRSGIEGNYEWNQALRSGDPSKIGQYETEIKVLASALNKLPKFTGLVHRFAHLPEEVWLKYRPGEIIHEPQFTSTSRVLRDLAGDFSNTLFEIRLNGINGHNIDFLNSAETEVLVNANAAFRVVSVSDRFRPRSVRDPSSKMKYRHIVLEEVPSPATSSEVATTPVRVSGPARASVPIRKPAYLYGNGKELFYFHPDNRVEILGSRIMGRYQVMEDRLILTFPGRTLELRSGSDGQYFAPDGSVFTRQ